MKLDGIKLQTKRKYKTVKQGTWSRYTVDFVEPEEKLKIEISKIQFLDSGAIDIAAKVIAPLKLFGRMSQWQRDVQLISLSLHADAVVAMSFEGTVQVHVNSTKFPPDVYFQPVVQKASVSLVSFEVDRISRLHGDPAELLGKGIREVLEEKLKEYDDKLVSKMNREIDKQKDKLRLSLSEWANKKTSKNVK